LIGTQGGKEIANGSANLVLQTIVKDHIQEGCQQRPQLRGGALGHLVADSVIQRVDKLIGELTPSARPLKLQLLQLLLLKLLLLEEEELLRFVLLQDLQLLNQLLLLSGRSKRCKSSLNCLALAVIRGCESSLNDEVRRQRGR